MSKPRTERLQAEIAKLKSFDGPSPLNQDDPLCSALLPLLEELAWLVDAHEWDEEEEEEEPVVIGGRAYRSDSVPQDPARRRGEDILIDLPAANPSQYGSVVDGVSYVEGPEGPWEGMELDLTHEGPCPRCGQPSPSTVRVEAIGPYH